MTETELKQNSALRDAPIGVFDSGVGGLTVVREIIRQIPNEKIVYFGDTARVPYGNKSRETVTRFSEQIVRFLRTFQVKTIVVACNTASAYAMEALERDCDIPVIGVVKPGARAAVSATKNGRIGVIATEATIGSQIYTRYIQELKHAVSIYGKACPLFVPLVEEGLLEDLEKPVDLKLMPLEHYKKTLLNLREYSLQYPDAEKPVFSGMTFSVEQGDRIALHGKNGCGKSTLIKMILQKARAADSPMDIRESGVCETAPGLVISYVNQDTSMLRGSLAAFCDSRHLEESLFLAILRQLDLERVQFSKNMEDYSEGQKKKVLLAASLLKPAHLYVWDEPLNYIDVFSRMQLEKLLLAYRPTMLFVEHDGRFRENIATKTLQFHGAT